MEYLEAGADVLVSSSYQVCVFFSFYTLHFIIEIKLFDSQVEEGLFKK